MSNNSDNQFSNQELLVMEFLYKHDISDSPKDNIETISLSLDMDEQLVLLIISKLINIGFVSVVVDSWGSDRYVLTQNGFEFMKIT